MMNNKKIGIDYFTVQDVNEIAKDRSSYLSYQIGVANHFQNGGDVIVYDYEKKTKAKASSEMNYFNWFDKCYLPMPNVSSESIRLYNKDNITDFKFLSSELKIHIEKLGVQDETYEVVLNGYELSKLYQYLAGESDE